MQRELHEYQVFLIPTLWLKIAVVFLVVYVLKCGHIYHPPKNAEYVISMTVNVKHSRPE